MTAPNDKGWFLDLSHTCDEVLLLFAQEARSQPARDELTCRHWQQFKARLSRHAVRLRLAPWDLDDAHQQAFFWIQEAITAFDPRQLFLPRGSSFQTFLHRILRLRLLDFSRSLSRRKKRFHLTGELGHWPDGFSLERTAAISAREAEPQRQLENALSRLEPEACALWNELRQGKRLRDLPDVLGVSYRTLKRRWRKLRDQVASALLRLEEPTRKPTGP